jgi:hypothetical protein
MQAGVDPAPRRTRPTCRQFLTAQARAVLCCDIVRRECPDRMLIADGRHLTTVPGAYSAHYNRHRPYRSLGQRPPAPRPMIPNLPAGTARRRPILGGLTSEYTQAA